MSLERINNYLARDFGYFNGIHPLYRVVWSHNQLEKRWVTHTIEGIELLNPVVEERPKYRHYIDNKYILERCLAVPEFVKSDLVNDFSYEPLHVFRIGMNDGYEFDTFYGACKFVIESVLERSRLAVYGSRYKSEEEKHTPDENIEARKLEYKKMEEFLFGNESELVDNLATGSGIVVPNNFMANGTSLIKE